MVNIDERTNRILNVVKAKYGLKDKSEAIQVAMKQYEEELLEPEFRPEFIAKLKRHEKTDKYIHIKNPREYFRKLAEE